MANITVNPKNGTIELTKAFYTASTKYGSDEYKELQNVRRDYPTYQVVATSHKAGNSGRNNFKGLSFEYMELYIEKHDDEEKSIMEEFNMLRAKGDDYEALGMESESYVKIKSWFLDQFPDVANFQNKREEVLAKVQQKQEAARKAKQAAAIQARRAALLAKIA